MCYEIITLYIVHQKLEEGQQGIGMFKERHH